MGDDPGRSTTTIALLLVAVLVGLWLLRFVIGVFVRLAQVALVVGLVLVAGYLGYRFWRGWTDAGEDRQSTRHR